MQKVFTARIFNGELQYENPSLVAEHLKTFTPQDVLTVRIEKRKRDRTLEQNSLYWAILSVIAEETGHTENELHEIFKAKYLPPKFVAYNGQEYMLAPSTTGLSTKEMTTYIDRIILEANELNIIIPTMVWTLTVPRLSAISPET